MPIDNEHFCAAPWTSLYLDPDGEVKSCCVNSESIGNINDESLDAIIAGPRAKQIKSGMLDDQAVPTCDACWRQHSTKRLQNFYNDRYLDTSRFPEHDPQWYSDPAHFRPRYLDLRWNNTCNFACIYCNPILSSLWADISHSQDLGHRIPIKPTRGTKQQILDWTLLNLRDLDWVNLAGGEPLMIKENLALLRQLYQVNPDCTLSVNSNLSVLDGNEIFQIIKQFRNVHWSISGEAVGARYEYIRWPGVWAEFYENLHTVKELETLGHSLSFHLVGMNLNGLAMWDYVDLLRDQKLCREDHHINIGLYNNRDSRYQWAIQRASPGYKDLIKNRILQGDYAKLHGIENYRQSLDDPSPQDSPDGLGLAMTALRQLDHSRGLDSRLVFPEFYQS